MNDFTCGQIVLIVIAMLGSWIIGQMENNDNRQNPGNI